MGKMAKLTVSTGWAGGDHVDYWELPDNFDELTAEEKDFFLHEMAQEYMFEVCSAYGEVSEGDED